MKKRVLVIGGGIAGLGAAQSLAANGHAVTILEAKERLGGRIHTLHDRGFPIELGAEFLHGQTKPVSEALEKAGLLTHSIPERYQYFEDGKFHRENLWDKMSALINLVDPKAPDRSFHEFLDSQKLNERDQRHALGFIRGFHAADPRRISAHALLRGEFAAEHMESAAQQRIDKGYSALVDFIADQIRDRGGEILTNAKVKRVRWESGKVEITFETPSAEQSIDAEAAIITLPLGVLKSGVVDFDPSLVDKREAIEQLQFGNVVRIVFVFKEEWWPEKNFGFVTSFEEPIPTWWTDSRGPLLTGWAGGPKADLLINLTAAELEEVGLKALERIFKVSGIKSHLVAAHSHNWTQDVYARGAYSYIPVSGLDLPKLLAAPLAETLYFAGEATVGDAQMGTVFGAYESGLRAAREIGPP